MIKGIRKIVVLEQADDGTLSRVAEYKKSEKRRKRSRGTKRPEQNTRKVYSAVRTYIDELEDRHDRSARKKRDGWLIDAPQNELRATRKALGKLRKIRMF